MERGVKRNDTKVMRYEHMKTVDPGPENAVPLQPSYPESGEVEGANSKGKYFQSGCDDENSSKNDTGKLDTENKSDGNEQYHFTNLEFSGWVDNVSKYGEGSIHLASDM